MVSGLHRLNIEGYGQGVDASKPGSPAEGDMYWATDTDKLYVYDGAAWSDIGGGAGADKKVAVDSLATADYLGATDGVGVLQCASTLTKVDQGNSILLGVDPSFKDNWDNAHDHISADGSSHSKVVSAYNHISASGSSHTYLNQSVTTSASPTFNGLHVDYLNFADNQVDADSAYHLYLRALGSTKDVILRCGNSGIIHIRDSSNSGEGLYPDGNYIVATDDFEVTGNLVKGTGSFKIDHPLDPLNKFLVHSFVEAPERLNMYRGVIECDKSVELVMPDYFWALNREVSVQVTPVDNLCLTSYRVDEAAEKITLLSDGKCRLSYVVYGDRKDRLALDTPLEVEEVKERGYYRNPELWLDVDKDAMSKSKRGLKASDRGAL